jgi:molecular chaperone DnaK
LKKINEAWKNASEELYKAQAESGKATEPNQDDSKKSSKKGKGSDDDVQDVDFEEVK